MLGHTRKHHIKQTESSRIEEAFVTADEFFKDSFGDRPKRSVLLAGARKRDGLTQKELGEMIGVSQYNISKMERGHRSIGKNIAKRLAKVFKTDYRLFL
ncbi:MAG: hypothetical protein K940chlam7_00765 [Chlamydiae bacterium]|nr:hypothetical protein [Chlamydiota bacterium]